MPDSSAHIAVQNLKVAYGDYVVMHDVNFTVGRGDVFVIMGGSGSGKSTLLNTMIGLRAPTEGDVLYDGESFPHADAAERHRMTRRFGVLFQFGALWSDLTLAENVALPLQQFTRLGRNEIRELAELKLSLVGLSGFGGFYPSEVSGGMVKRGGLARAMALDPEILFFDEPSSGLDPISARRLDELILELRNSLGATLVIVTHDLASIFATATNGIFLDARKKTVTAWGDPHQMLAHPPDPYVEAFLTRSVDKEST
jgi:phospholipid/cholesterol/gamma-HCH transport system ATP-binding protein